MAAKRTVLFLESLEDRTVPTTVLAIGGLTSFNFLTPGGVPVTAQISGTSGQATFADDLSSISLSNTSSDFQLNLSSTATGVVPIGLINATGQTINSVRVSGTASFQLGGYIGTDFSSGGGLFFSTITGNVQLQNLSPNTAIQTAGALSGSVIIADNLQGEIEAGGFWSGNLLVGGDVATTGDIVAASHLTGTVEVGGNFWGDANIGGRAYGRWQIIGSIETGADLQAGQDFNQLYVTGDVAGEVTGDTTVWMQVGGSIDPTADISSPNLTVTLVGGSDLGTESGAVLFVQVAESIGPTAVLHATQEITANYGSSISTSAQLTAPVVAKTNLTNIETGTVIGSLPILITQPGTYRLTSDLTYSGSSGQAIEIMCNDVTLDLEGFSIIGTAGSTSIADGVAAYNQTGVSIINGTITGFMFGIRAEGGQYTVQNIRATNNWYVGISVIGAGSVVTNNAILNTGGSTFSSAYTLPIALRAEGNGITIENNIISGITLTAITAETIGLDTDQVVSGTITNNFFGMAATFVGGWAIWVNSTPSVGVSDPLFAGNVTVNFPFAMGLASANATLQNNTFLNASNGVVAGPTAVTDAGGNVMM